MLRELCKGYNSPIKAFTAGRADSLFIRIEDCSFSRSHAFDLADIRCLREKRDFRIYG
jgi:hypothetical protein